MEETRRPEDEREEPIFEGDRHEPPDGEPEFSEPVPPPTLPASLTEREGPAFASASEVEGAAAQDTAGESAAAAMPAGGGGEGEDEPVFGAGAPASMHTGERESAPAEPPAFESPAAGAAPFGELGLPQGERPEREDPQVGTDLPADSASSTAWVNIATDSRIGVEEAPQEGYSSFAETPGADEPDPPASRRRLGRTGPVWVLGGAAVVVVVGLVWLGVARIGATSDATSQPASDPTVQKVVAQQTPTPAPPTPTAGPTPSPTPVLLPINANVVVGDTEGQGVLLREAPGRSGRLVTVLEEGTTLVVLNEDPDAPNAEYPVSLDGYLWYRMRVPGQVDAEGVPVVGWSASSFFVVDGQ